MITGDLKSKIDAVWNDFWSGGISNPLEVMEQLSSSMHLRSGGKIRRFEERCTARSRMGSIIRGAVGS